MNKEKRELIDPKTGEVFNVEVDLKKYDLLAKKGWRRTDIKNLFYLLIPFGGKKFEILAYLLNIMDGKNRIDITQKKLEQILGISTQTISTAFKELQELGLIKKINNYYIINTNLISTYGKTEANLYKSIEYGFYENKEERKKSYSEKVQEKLNQIEKLQSDINLLNIKRSNSKKLTKEELNNIEE